MKAQTKTRRPRKKNSVDVAALLEKGDEPLFSARASVRHQPFKRLFDVTFSLFALAITAPLWILCTLAVRLTSKGPAIFASERVGRGGRLIYCYKFRTMYCDAEERLRELLEACPKRASEYLTHRKITDDPRITPVGQFLRRYSIDEIPQFINVLFGELSIVGPRPYFARELGSLSAKERDILLCVRPGLTGPWQTGGRSEIPFKKRVAIELEYVKRATFFSDLMYIFKTLPSVLLSRGAR